MDSDSTDVGLLRAELGAPPIPHCVALVHGHIGAPRATISVDGDRMHEMIEDGKRRVHLSPPGEADGFDWEEGEEDEEAEALQQLWGSAAMESDGAGRPILYAWPMGHAVTALRELGSAVGAAHLHPCVRIPLMRCLPADGLQASIARSSVGSRDASLVTLTSGEHAGHLQFASRHVTELRAAAAQTQEVLRLSPAFMHHLEGRLNPSQMQAVVGAATRRGFSLVQGPPGTGKSTAVLQLLNAMHLSAVAGYHEFLLRGEAALRKED